MNILLVRLDGVGDAAVCVPLIAGLLAAGHTVGAALSTRNAGLYTSRVQPVHVLERIPWPQHGSTPATRARAEREIATAGYDVALVASEEPEAYELAMPVRERTGFTTGWAKPFKSLWTRRRLSCAIRRGATVGDDALHEVEIMARLGAAYGAGEPARDPAVLRSVLFDAPHPARSGIVVQLGAKWTAIGIRPDVLRPLVGMLAARGATTIAAPNDRAAALEQAGGIPVDIPADLAAWKGRLDGARVVVSVDTGAAHVAGMLGVPVVDVFPDEHFAAQRTRWEPWAAPSVVLPASLVCDDGHRVLGDALDAL